VPKEVKNQEPVVRPELVEEDKKDIEGSKPEQL
jgi:hypothetical protein